MSVVVATRRTRRMRPWPLVTIMFAFVLILSSVRAGVPAQASAVATPTASAAPLVFTDQLARLFPSYFSPQMIYAVSDQALYRSQDSSMSWQLAGLLPPADELAVGGKSSNTLLAGGHIPCGAAGGEEPLLFRSEDGGRSWTPVAGVEGVQPVAIWNDGQTSLGADCHGLRVQRGSDQTWETFPLPDSSFRPSAVVPVTTISDSFSPMALVIGTSEGGTSRLWRADLTMVADQAFEALNLEPFSGYGALATRDNLYAVGTKRGVFVSTDAGESFSPQPGQTGLGGIVSVDPSQADIPAAEVGFGVSAVAIAPYSSSIYAGTADGVYQSDDAGDTWQKLPGVDSRVSKLVILPSGTALLAETDAGIVSVPLQP